MGEVARRILLRLAERGNMFGGVKGHATGTPLARGGALGSDAVAAIDHDDTPDLHVTSDALAEALGMRDMRLRELKIVRNVCMMVANRSARLCAAGVAAVLENCGLELSKEPVVVAVDGSVFAKYPKYRQRLREALVELIGEETARQVTFKLVHGGSASGAAFIAAAATSKAYVDPDS
jgi:hexokinase